MSINNVKQNSIARNQGVVRAPQGFLIGPDPPNSLLLHYTKWQDWSPSVEDGIDTELLSSVGTMYKRVGNQVFVILNVQFVYSPPGAAGRTVTLGNLPLAAAADNVYTNNTIMDVGFTVPPSMNHGALRIDPSSNASELIVQNSIDFVDGTTYTVKGELVYLTDA